MITLNNTKWAENEKEFASSLFEPGGTCVGYAKRSKRKIKLMDHNKKLVGVVTCYGVVAAAHKTEDGRYWYNYEDIPQIGDYSFSDKSTDIAGLSIWHDWSPKGELRYQFK